MDTYTVYIYMELFDTQYVHINQTLCMSQLATRGRGLGAYHHRVRKK